MTKKTDDYMHLYINACKYRVSFVENPDRFSLWSILTPRRYLGVVNDASVHTIQVQLRPLPSMTEDECLQAAEVLGGAQHISDENRVIQFRYLMKGMHSGQTNIPGMGWIKLAIHLLSQGFDIFGLIDAGLAIDSTTLNPKP
jgi:hypothetical protein